MTQNREFGFETTADEVLEGMDLTGRRILITGGTSGLGAESARALASKGAQVVITARSQAKGDAAAARISEAAGGSTVEVVVLELSSLASIREAAENILDKYEAFDVLINNAGVMACAFDKTPDGFERQLGVNHVGHFLFTGLIMPALLRGNAPRIVNLSSRGHHFSPVNLEDPHYASRSYEKWSAYGQSKTANILFTVELERRLADKGLHAYALHPGAIMTDLGRHLDEADVTRFQAAIDSGAMKMKSVEAGAATQVYAATAPELEGQGGVYLDNCRIAPIEDDPQASGVRSYALDPDAASRLWKLSEDWVEQSFSW